MMIKKKVSRAVKTETAVFAAGCFWGVQYVFDKFPGVVKTEVGYTGGSAKNPSYMLVCTGLTGHAEAVRIEFNPKEISYEKLLEIFWKCHDPTQRFGQGPDIGYQYRSAIFYLGEEQKIAATRSLKAYEKELGKKIATSIEPASEFYLAEDHHQGYYKKKNGTPYCHIVPKVKV